MTMADTAALVPAPFYPLVRVDPGASHRFNDLPQRPGPIDPPERTTAAEQRGHRMAYSREGFPIADRQVGTQVDIYV